MKTTAILDLMVKDHAKILKLLNAVEASIRKDFSSLIKSFNTFEWNLEKHIFLEERAIFISYHDPKNIEGYTMVPKFLEEHIVILDKLSGIRKDILRRGPLDLSQFKILLMNHKNSEEKSLYPKLDEELDEIKKEYIIERINEII
jgi:hemerythrin superfamily protein